MAAIPNSCLILLTYKGKILLLSQDDNTLNKISQNAWQFIAKLKEKNTPIKETITREVERETHIKLNNVNFVLSMLNNGKTEYLFHATLTDNDVNRIERSQGSILQFYTLKEVKNLQLQTSTEYILSNYKNLIENLPQN